MATLKDLQDQRFGRLTVIGPHVSRNRRTYWTCRCDCGNVIEVLASNLSRSNTTSCGCVRSEATAVRNLKHGQAPRGQRAPEYKVWLRMRDRCRRSSDKDYAAYGGRGITVCDRWLDYANFIADMGPRPSPDHQLERIDNDGPYSPENCRWATRTEQASNRRDNVFYEHDGQRATLREWARRTGLPFHTVYQRINRLGWSVERALTTPVRPLRKR